MALWHFTPRSAPPEKDAEAARQRARELVGDEAAEGGALLDALEGAVDAWRLLAEAECGSFFSWVGGAGVPAALCSSAAPRDPSQLPETPTHSPAIHRFLQNPLQTNMPI